MYFNVHLTSRDIINHWLLKVITIVNSTTSNNHIPQFEYDNNKNKVKIDKIW